MKSLALCKYPQIFSTAQREMRRSTTHEIEGTTKQNLAVPWPRGWWYQLI